MGAHRAVVVSDFEILQELLNKPETVDRQQFLPEIAGKTQFFTEQLYNVLVEK